MTTALALMEDQALLGEVEVYGKISHSERLMDLLKTLLKAQDLTVGDMDLLVTGIGPGSFTGIRIAVTTIRTLAQALGKEAVGVSSLKALASQGRGLVVPVFDARRGRVYTGFYQVEGDQVTCIKEDGLVPLEDLLRDLPKEARFIGDGLRVYKDQVEEAGFEIFPQRDWTLRGSSLCMIGSQDRDQSSGNYLDILPNYVRPSQAERERKK